MLHWTSVPLQKGECVDLFSDCAIWVHCTDNSVRNFFGTPCRYLDICFIFLLLDKDISPKGVLKNVERNCKIGAQRLPLLAIIDLETTNDLPDIPFHSMRCPRKFKILSRPDDNREIFYFVPAFQFWLSFNWEIFNFMIRSLSFRVEAGQGARVGLWHRKKCKQNSFLSDVQFFLNYTTPFSAPKLKQSQSTRSFLTMKLSWSLISCNSFFLFWYWKLVPWTLEKNKMKLFIWEGVGLNS